MDLGMNEKQIVELIIKKIGPIGCCQTQEGRERRRYRGRIWRWFLMVNEEWKETNKHVLRGMIWRALPSRIQEVKNVNRVLAHIKITCYSEKFEKMGWLAEN